MPKDLVYISVFEIVTKPKIVINTPSIENIKPIGILISTIFLSSYQNKILKITHITPTSTARPTGRLYHATPSSTVRGVKE